MKHFAVCNFDCGFLKRKQGEEISSEKFNEMKSKLKPEMLPLFVRSEGSEKQPESAQLEESSEVEAPKASKKSKK